jgi:hypothetical protein
MSNIKEQFTNIYQEYFLGKKIMDLEINMISDEYLEYEEGKTWMTEGGIQIKLDDDSIISFSYDTDNLQFICVESSLLPFISDFDYYPIELESKAFVDILEETIIDIDIVWVDIKETDYSGNEVSSEPFAVGFFFKFENEATLQIASVVSKINAETQKFSQIDYAIEGSILVSFCNPIAI